jgi:2-polyprenyl-3-methyl-5-hydroxy-6-metoxy-1,4-benzoquinol methylase
MFQRLRRDEKMTTGKRDFDIEAASWDEEPRRVQLAKELFSAICGEVPLTPTMTVLDYGCGTGLVTLPLSARTGHVTGADSSQGMLDVLDGKIRACQIANVVTQRIDPACGAVLEGAYDLVVSTMTMHHVQDIAPLLKQFAAVLKPGGYLCVADLDSENGEFHGNNDGVFHLGFDRPAFRDLLSDAGLADIADRTAAAEIGKPDADGQVKTYSVFLMTARKRATE